MMQVVITSMLLGFNMASGGSNDAVIMPPDVTENPAMYGDVQIWFCEYKDACDGDGSGCKIFNYSTNICLPSASRYPRPYSYTCDGTNVVYKEYDGQTNCTGTPYETKTYPANKCEEWDDLQYEKRVCGKA